MKRLTSMQRIAFFKAILYKFKLQKVSAWACLQFRKVEQSKVQRNISKQRKCNGIKRRIEG